MSKIGNIIKNETLILEQRKVDIVQEVESDISILNIDKKVDGFREKGVASNLINETFSYRPTYIIPNYGKFMEEGSEFLELVRPTDIWEAINNLLIFYNHLSLMRVAPIYIGNIDILLDPFIKSEREARKAIKFFLIHIDKAMSDSFCYGNIGPKVTRGGRIILELEREIKDSLNSLILNYSKEFEGEITNYEKTNLKKLESTFIGDKVLREYLEDNGNKMEDSNKLSIGSSMCTSAKLNLEGLGKNSRNKDDFFSKKLPIAVKLMADYIDKKRIYSSESSSFFENNFLVKEGLIEKDKFVFALRLVGLSKTAEYVMSKDGFKDTPGNDETVDELKKTIINTIQGFISQYKNLHFIILGGELLIYT